jgi:hypothetical protein
LELLVEEDLRALDITEEKIKELQSHIASGGGSGQSDSGAD